MNKFKKGAMLVGCCILFAGCSQNYMKPVGTEETQQTQQAEEHLVTLEQVRSEIDKTMEKARSGGYPNLSFVDFDPIVTKEDSVCDVVELVTQTGAEKKTIEETVREQYQWLCHLTGKKLKKSEVQDSKSGLSLDEVEKRLEKGTYPEKKGVKDGFILPELSYYTGNESNHQCIDVYPNKCSLYMRFSSVFYSEDVSLVKEYRTNVKDKSLEDSYELEDGPCTVKEAIQWVEDYVNGGNPYKPGKDFEIKSSSVRVYKRKNGKYIYAVGIRRIYRGVAFQNVFQGSSVDVARYDYDMGEVKMINRTCPDVVDGLGANEIMTPEGEPYEKIISLDRAFEIINNRVAQNAQCKVLSAELAYCKYPKDELYISEEYGRSWSFLDKVVWKIEVENKTDSRIITFFIGVTDYEGEKVERIGVR